MATQLENIMSDKIVYLSDDSFENDVLKSELPVLVDFWAEWCGPCKMIAPILDDVAEEYAGQLTIAKLNIDQNNASPVKYGVRGIPTLLLFKNGELLASKVGALSKTQLKEFIDAQI
ncbi:thioredoxin [Shewanella carassii]|uniref:Thioredoxin n=2 Tax=Shewanella carassii TaxID=1987584 RepID=A0ABQ1TDC9_9GAMM|nr:thioredoxin [Shewanella carassii]GGE91904.1 thioredoxin [Shewanella carassii]